MTDLRIQAEVSVDGRRAEQGLARAAANVADVASALEGARTEATSAAAAIAAVARAQADAAQAASSGGSDIAAPLEEVAGAAAGAVEGLKEVDKSQARAKVSAANLGQQIGDVASGLASGVPPAQIFAQQAGQLAFALSGMAGWLGRVGTFLSGPWGAAILGATVILASLTRGHKDADDAAAAQAKAEADLKKAIEELDRATDLSLKSQRESIRLGIEAAETALRAARAKREETKAALEAAIAERQATQIRAAAAGPRGEVATLGLQPRDGVIDGLQNQLAEVNREIARSAGLLRQAGFSAALADIEAGSSAAAIATRAYEDAQIDLQRAVREGTVSQADATRELAALKAVVDEAEAAERKGTTTRRAGSAALREQTRDMKEAERAAERLARALAPIFDAGQNQRGFAAALERTTAELSQRRGTPFFEADRPADTLTDAVREIEARVAKGGQAAGEAFSDAVLTRAVAIGQAIGGPAGRSISVVAGLLQGARTGNFTGVGGSLGGALTLFSGIRGKDGSAGAGFSKGFSQSIFGADGQSELGKALRPLKPMGDAIGRVFGDGGQKFGQFLGKAAGGAATGAAVAGLANAIGIKLNETGAQIGGGLGQLVGGPLGGLLGSIFGGIVGNLFAKSGSTTVKSSGGEISQSSTGSASVQRVTSGLGNTIQTAIQSIADQLGANVGNFSVSIGKRGSSFRVDSRGDGRIRGQGVTATKDEAEALQLAIADAIKDGAIVTSPRVQAALERFSDNANKALAEALKVKGLEDLIANRANPFATLFRDMELQIRQRNQVARQNGFDLAEIEKINGEQRAETLKNTLERTTGSIRQLLQEFTFGSGATGSAAERLRALSAERDRVAGLVRAGDTGQIETLANLTRQLDELQRDAFGSTGRFAAGRAESVSLLNDLVAQTETRIRAAADAARKNEEDQAARLASIDATAEDQFGQLKIHTALLASINASLAGRVFGGISVPLQDYAR